MVAVRSPARVDHAVQKKQSGSLLVLFGIEDYLSSGTIGARSGIHSLNSDGAAEDFGPGRDVEGMETLKIRRPVLGHCDHIDGAMLPGIAVDDRR